MVWKINKHRKSGDKRDISIKQAQKAVFESQPKIKSCLKKTKDYSEHKQPSQDFSPFQNDDSIGSRIQRDQSSKSGGSRSRSAKSGGSKRFSDRSVESLGSGNSSSVHSKRIALVEQHSESSRSRDQESRKSENAQSIQTISSEHSTASRSLSEVKKKKNVRFNVIYFRDYERMIGDNPSCTTGPPVGIGWSYGKTRVIDVNSYEAARSYRKSPSHLILSREEREALLLNWGASFHDIIEAVRSNLKIKNQRRQTVTNLGKVERIEEAFESATRKLKSALMLRRSTGNKVKRLQEQANLAQSALTSLKIAEDRALSEMRGARRVPIQEAPKNNEDFGISSSSTEDAESRRSHLILPEKEDQACSSKGGNNSTTQSELEIERFYRELELEMFGDDEELYELPSMVGQMLEVPAINILNNDVSVLRLDNAAADSNESYQDYKDDFDDALLERERNRSMISQSLLQDAESDNSKNRNYVSSRYQHYEGRRPSYSADSRGQNPRMTRVNESSKYQESHTNHQQTIPLHAGMTMFEDCALLGGQNGMSAYREKKKKRLSSHGRDPNAGPTVQYIPPPSHLPPSHWMEDSDQSLVPSRGHDTITICEDNFGGKNQNGNRDYYSYNNVTFASNYY